MKRALEPEIAEEAKKRQGIRTDLGNQLSGKLPVSSDHPTRDTIASYLGVGGRTLEKAEKIGSAGKYLEK